MTEAASIPVEVRVRNRVSLPEDLGGWVKYEKLKEVVVEVGGASVLLNSDKWGVKPKNRAEARHLHTGPRQQRLSRRRVHELALDGETLDAKLDSFLIPWLVTLWQDGKLFTRGIALVVSETENGELLGTLFHV